MDYYESNTNQPKLRSVLFLFFLGTVVFTFASLPFVPDSLVIGLYILSGGAYFFTFFAFINWLHHIGSIRVRERNAAEAITEYSIILDKLALLRSDQTIIAPQLTYNSQINVVMGDEEEGPRFFLQIPFGLIPWEFVIDFIKNSGIVNLCPIGHYKEGSYKFGVLPDREYANMLTKWLCILCLANEAPANTGPKPATWVNRDSKNRAIKRLGLDMNEVYPYKDLNKTQPMPPPILPPEQPLEQEADNG